uniref:Uncharacterized protein LOC104219405 n=1 Tax=Nicotiana sylvestris TaxID=4096 RepID=A0A1U7VTX3_NICSY|nr:PREDICTED: uncharacterized protein LOC104219405 [Nicotiana sylvestris]
MRGKMNDYRPAYWSFISNQLNQKFQSGNYAMKDYNPQPIYHMANNPPKSTRITTSSSKPNSYTLPTKRNKNSEAKRKKRVASYKSYTIEGKLKSSIRDSFRWIKNKYSSILHRH